MKTKLVSIQHDQVENKTIYPYVGILCDSESEFFGEKLMVLFVDRDCGICIRRGPTANKEGMYTNLWGEKDFIRFKGKIVLEILNED
jgi:hypothetical protein